MGVDVIDAALRAYAVGRADGLAGRRDPRRAGDARTGRDYRVGFLDGRIEVYRVLAHARKIIEAAGDEPTG